MQQNALQPNQSSKSVGTANVEILPQLIPTEQRTTLIVTNTSTGGQTITVQYGKPAVSGDGIVLYPGGSLSEAYDGAFLPSSDSINCVASASGGSVAFHERHV